MYSIYYLMRYLTSIFTVVKKLIYIDNKKHNKMQNFKLMKWVAAGRYMSNINKRERKKLVNW